VILNLGNQADEYEDFTGENVTLGALWNPTYKWSIGLRYDSAFTGDVDFKSTGSNIQLTLPRLGEPLSSNPFAYLFVAPQVRHQRREVTFPASLAIGVAHRPNDRTTYSMDVTRTDWNDFYVDISDGNRRSLVDFSNVRDLLGHTDFKPTTTVRFGVEHVFIPREPEVNLGRLWTLRGGLFYDEEPATGIGTGFRWPWDFGNGKPDSFYGAAVGLGLLLNQRVNLDVAYQLRYGNDVNRDFLRGVPGFSEDVYQHRVLLSTVIYF
jgi:long-subunit fatty acid transport protein